MAQPLVSVITPTYNRASFLAETIESVLAQDYPNLEYIVLDDGSTDHTRDLLAEHNGRLIWETHPNVGEAETVNKGLAMARGDIVMVVNSDDPLLEQAISIGVEFLQGHPEVLVAYPDWVMIDSDFQVIQHVRVPDYDYVNMLKTHHCLVGPGAFIRREAIRLGGFRDPTYRLIGDFEWWLRLGLHGKFSRIPQTIATWRFHSEAATVSSRGRTMADEHIRLVREYFQRKDVPNECQAVRRHALASAYLIAAAVAGAESAFTAKTLAKAVLYDPAICVRPEFVARLRAVFAAVLPVFLRKGLSRVFHIGSILGKASRGM